MALGLGKLVMGQMWEVVDLVSACAHSVAKVLAELFSPPSLHNAVYSNQINHTIYLFGVPRDVMMGAHWHPSCMLLIHDGLDGSAGHPKPAHNPGFNCSAS